MKIQLIEGHNSAGLTDWMCEIGVSKTRRQLIRDTLDEKGQAKLKEGFYLKQDIDETGFRTVRRYKVIEEVK